MKDLKHLEEDLATLLSSFMDEERAHLKGDDYPNTHDFLNIVGECEELIKRINGVE